jgi:hypothetical protein
LSISAATLDSALDSLTTPSTLPLALPIVHVTSARGFRAIVDTGALLPTPCTVFGEDVLYFFYGGGFYRPRNQQTQNREELPVALVFDPSLLRRDLRFYPCDTGALGSGRICCKAATDLEPFRERLKVDGHCDPDVPCKLVSHVFGDNARYLRGEVDPECVNKPDPFPAMYELLTTDLTPLGVDHRQSVVECQTRAPISLREHVLWVGFPETHTGVFADLYELTKPSVPDYYYYRAHVNFNPAQIAQQLQDRAADVIRRFEALPEATR